MQFHPSHLSPRSRKILTTLLADARTDISLEHYRHEVNHLLDVLSWLYILFSRHDDLLDAAALLHDSERLIQGIRHPKRSDFLTYEAYKNAHTRLSITGARRVLRRSGMKKHFIEDVVSFLERYETHPQGEGVKLMIADSFSFFHKNLLDYYRWKGKKQTKNKILFMYRRLPKEFREKMKRMHLDCWHFRGDIRKILDQAIASADKSIE